MTRTGKPSRERVAQALEAAITDFQKFIASAQLHGTGVHPHTLVHGEMALRVFFMKIPDSLDDLPQRQATVRKLYGEVIATAFSQGVTTGLASLDIEAPPTLQRLR